MSNHPNRFLIFFLAVMSLSAKISPAQESAFSMGTGLGLNVTNVSGKADLPSRSDIESFNLTGIRFYSLIGIKFNRRLVLLIEPSYEQKGFKQKELLVDSNITLDTSLWTVSGDLLYMSNYFTIPVTLNLTVGDRIRLNLGAGGYLGFLSESRLRVEADDLSPGVEDIDYSNSFSSMDFGALARVSVEFKLLTFLAIELGGSYSVGLKDVATEEYFSDETLKNKSLYAGAGLRFYFAGSGSE